MIATVLAVPVSAQVRRLVDTIEAPLAYLCLEATPAAAGGAAEPGPVQRLLADPSLDALFASDLFAGDRDGPQPADGSTRALALVRGVLGRSSGELEIALTGIVPGAGQPLLVLRARLQPREADALQMKLDANELAAPSGHIGGRTTYRLRGGASEQPGGQVELALVGADLIVGNDGSALREVLDPQQPVRTSARGASTVLSADPRFVAMRQALPTAPGSLWLYGDWRRLGDRIQASLDGVHGMLVGSSGLGSARAVMASVSAAQADLTATLLLDFDVAPAPPAGPNVGRGGRNGGGGRPDERGGRPSHGPGPQPTGIDGWFAAVEPVAARTLLAELPSSGLGGLVLSVDLARIAGGTRGGWHLVRDLDRAFRDYGLDFDRNVRARLGSRGTVQLHLGATEAGAAVTAIYALRIKNKKAAADLFADVRRVAEPAGLATAVVREVDDGGRERRTVELLELRAPHGRTSPLFVAAHEDSLLLSADADALAAVADEARRAGKPRQRRGEGTAAAIGAIGGENVAGLFDVDLLPLLERVGEALAKGGARVDLSALPKRHVGYLDLQRRDDGTLVRVRLLASR